MPLDHPKVQSALEELKRRGILPPTPTPPSPGPAPMIETADIQATGAQPAPDLSSPRDVERQLRLKKMKGDLAVQDAVNELKRRGVNLQLRTQPAVEKVTEVQAKESVENVEKQGDPEAFKGAWRQLFPGKPLPRTPEGQIDYAGGQDDIDIEVDRVKKLQAAKAGVHNVTESKVKRINPTTKLEEEVLVRTDKVSGGKLGETVLSSQKASLSEQEAGAQRYSSRLAFNQKILLDTESKGFDPTSLGTTVQTFLPNRFKSDDVQAYNAAKQNWIAAVLRKESGAAIAKKEYDDASRQYFPQDGDSKAVVKQKQALRELAEEEMTKSVGPSAPDRVGAAPVAPAPTGTTAVTETETVSVTTPAEAPPTAKFIRSPSGKVYRNPKYTGAP
jgi:hypothetical protein